MHTSQEFNDLVVREDADRIIRLSDVGRAELGPQDTRSYMKMNGIPMVGIVVIPQPGANHIEIADEVYRRMESMKKDLPEDVVTDYGFDNTRFIRASIDEVKQTAISVMEVEMTAKKISFAPSIPASLGDMPRSMRM